MAGPNAGFKVAVHVQAHSAKQQCSALPAISGCGDIQTTYAGENLDFFPVFYDLVDYKTFAYGVTWPDSWGTCVFSACSFGSIGTIQTSGDGITHSYSPCRPGPVAIPGWGWLYANSQGFVCVVQYPDPGEPYLMSGCDEQFDNPDCNFCAGVNGAYGDDPCGPSSTEPSSWSEIKAIFE
jgi:hypothetical protein